MEAFNILFGAWETCRKTDVKLCMSDTRQVKYQFTGFCVEKVREGTG